MPEFSLIEGEKIIEEIKPLPALKKYFFIKWLIGLVFIPFIIGLVIFSETISLSIRFKFFVGIIFFIISSITILVIYLVVAWALSSASYNKFYYWIINKRIVTKRGIIGYQIVSIPYERISDIIISRTFLERICGISSLHIQSLAG
jgi:uncharacterized membrane protein YdbT with pleckstrin-like domain